MASAYFGEVKGFSVRKQNEGAGPSVVVFLNGFLSQPSDDARDWKSCLRRREKWVQRPWYHIAWEAKSKSDLGRMVCKDVSGQAAKAFAARLAKRATRLAGKKLSPITWAAAITDILANPWHSAMKKASMTGFILADLMARSGGREFVLMGHSLGARVIYYALAALSTRQEKIVRDVYLLGGAVDRNDESGWGEAIKSVKGRIYNCFSSKDQVLTCLYRGANAFLSDPIGLGPIVGKSEQVSNIDCSDLVDSHMVWKEHLPAVLDRIETRSPGV